MFEADRIAWTRPRLLVAGTKRIGRWLELLRANVDVRIHHVERLPDARAVTISGLHTPASFLRALARQAGGLDVRIHADGSLEVVRTRDAERLAGLVAGVGDAPWIRRETLEAICDLGRARGSDDIPPDVDRWCEALATTLVNEFALEKKTAQGFLPLGTSWSRTSACAMHGRIPPIWRGRNWPPPSGCFASARSGQGRPC